MRVNTPESVAVSPGSALVRDQKRPIGFLDVQSAALDGFQRHICLLEGLAISLRTLNGPFADDSGVSHGISSHPPLGSARRDIATAALNASKRMQRAGRSLIAERAPTVARLRSAAEALAGGAAEDRERLAPVGLDARNAEPHTGDFV